MSDAPTPALLIAVTGIPGQGRTALLAALAAEQCAAGRRVVGALPGAGADGAPENDRLHQQLHLLGETGELPRGENEAAADDTASGRLRRWADGLRRQPPADLLVLAEFGPREARGEGLMPLWPALAAAAPAMAVLGVRAEFVGEIERRIGRRFDVRIAASDPDAAARLRQAGADFGEWTRLGLWGGAAGGIEAGVGSLLHATRVPLRGLSLSSVQTGMLTLASAGLSQPARVAWVALVAAGLKALSPGGSRIRPMVAIAMQGLLFGASVQALGWNLGGLAVGATLVGAWASLQGVLLHYVLLGDELMGTYQRIAAWVQENFKVAAPGMAALLAAWAAVHIAAALAAVVVAWRWRAPPRALQAIIDREIAALSVAPDRGARVRSRGRRIAREFGRWQFWLPLAIVAFVLLASGRGWEPVAWVLVRFVAVGFVVLALFSLVQPAWIAEHLRRRGWWGPAAAFASLRRPKS